MNISYYTGLPYDFRRRNCWHHVRNVRADAGLFTPEFDVISLRQINDAFTNGHADSKGLTRQQTPQNLDAVLLGEKLGSRIIWHAGVYYDGYVSHCSLEAKQVKLDRLTDLLPRYAEVEFWR